MTEDKSDFKELKDVVVDLNSKREELDQPLVCCVHKGEIAADQSSVQIARANAITKEVDEDCAVTMCGECLVNVARLALNIASDNPEWGEKYLGVKMPPKSMKPGRIILPNGTGDFN